MAFGLESLDWPDEIETALSRLSAGHSFATPDVLFAKISDEDRDHWAERFAGTR